MSISKRAFLEATGGFPQRDLLIKTAYPIDIAKYLPKKCDNLYFYDIETERPNFKHPKWPLETRFDIACGYSTRTRKFQFFTESDLKSLLLLARRSDAVVTFNGPGFDDKIVAAKLGLKKGDIGFRFTIDLMAIIERVTGRMHSLNNLAYVNLGESKKVFGVNVPNLPKAGKKAACKSDVLQLHRLFDLAVEGRLRVPACSITNKEYEKLPFGGRCPVCNDIACINELPSADDDSTEGQIHHFNESTRSYAHRCFTCGTVFIFENGALRGMGPDTLSAVRSAVAHEN